MAVEPDPKRQQVLKVLRFLREVARRREEIPRDLGGYGFCLPLRDIDDLPGVTKGTGIGEDDDLVLRVQRPKETECPSPPEQLQGWLCPGWEDPTCDVKVWETRNEERDGETVVIKFGDDPLREESLTEWTLRRTDWVKSEVLIRKATALYTRLYEQWAKIQRESERLMMAVGEGLLTWRCEGVSVRHPLLLQELDLRLDERLPALELRCKEVKAIFCSGLLRMLGCDGKQLGRLDARVRGDFQGEDGREGHRAVHEIGMMSPKIVEVLQEIVHGLFPDGTVATEEPDTASAKPTVIRGPILLLMKRPASDVNRAIDETIERLETGGELPVPLIATVCGSVSSGGSSLVPSSPDATKDTGAGRCDSQDGQSPDLLFTKPANAEQRRILETCLKQGQVAVQGPPGTGKSHTIANLIGHFLAEGRSVLVTSHTTKALEVVHDKLVETLQPLCVPVLDQEAKSREALERAVRGIIGGLQVPREQRSEAARQAALTRAKLKQELADVERRLSQAIRDEYDAIVVAGQKYEPAKAARKVAEEASLHDWLPGPLVAGEPCPLSDVEVDELYRLARTIAPADEHEVRQGIPDESEALSPAEVAECYASLEALKDRHRPDMAGLWAGSGSTSVAVARRIIELSERVLGGDDEADDLVMECRTCGRLGGTRREPWDSLVMFVEEIAAEIDRYNVEVVKHAPSMTCDLPRARILKALEEIAEHVSQGKSLGAARLLFKRDWRRVIVGSVVRGGPPVTAEDYRTLAALVRRDAAREALMGRWVAQTGGYRGGQLPEGVRPEDAVRDRLRAIRAGLNWNDEQCKPLKDALGQARFRWDEALKRVPLGPGPFAHLNQELRLVRECVIPAAREIERANEEASIRLRLRSGESALSAYPKSRVATAMAAALASESEEAYAEAYGEFKRLSELKPQVERFHRLLERLRVTAPNWAEGIESRALLSSGPPRKRSAASEAWVWRQLEQEITRRARVDLNELQRRHDECRDRLAEATGRYVEATVWERQQDRVSGPARMALMGWQQVVSRPGFNKGVRSAVLQAAARSMLKAAQTAVPVWIMPIHRVLASYCFDRVLFDVVIIDEASQCDMMGLLLLGVARNAIVVGDDKQVSPVAVGEDSKEMQALIDQMLDGVPGKDLFTGRQSMYHLADRCFGQVIQLVEHFRCVSDIIGFSNVVSYDGTIRPLRESSGVATVPHVVAHRVAGGRQQGEVNPAEALEVASLVAAMVRHPAYDGKTIGVIGMLGDEQNDLIERLLRQHVPESVHAVRKLMCGTPAQFQGDERDVVIMSLVYSTDSPPLRLLNSESKSDHVKRYNVAASRARDQLWVVHSLNVATDLKAEDIRARLLRHASDPKATARQVQVQGQRAESPFEAAVLRDLSASGYRVQAQVEVGAYRIDMVVIGVDGTRVALECDGDRYHPPEQLERDLDRQRVLERLGWRFVRIRGTVYFRDPVGTMARVRRDLKELGIEPIGALTSEENPKPTAVQEEILREASRLRQEWTSRQTTKPETEAKQEEAAPTLFGSERENRRSSGRRRTR